MPLHLSLKTPRLTMYLHHHSKNALRVQPPLDPDCSMYPGRRLKRAMRSHLPERLRLRVHRSCHLKSVMGINPLKKPHLTAYLSRYLEGAVHFHPFRDPSFKIPLPHELESSKGSRPSTGLGFSNLGNNFQERRIRRCKASLRINRDLMVIRTKYSPRELLWLYLRKVGRVPDKADCRLLTRFWFRIPIVIK